MQEKGIKTDWGGVFPLRSSPDWRKIFTLFEVLTCLYLIWLSTPAANANSCSADPHSQAAGPYGGSCPHLCLWPFCSKPAPLFLPLSCTQDLSCSPHGLTKPGTQLSFYEIPVLGFWEHDWPPCGEDRGTILCPSTSLNPFWNIHSETPGAFYSTSNIRPKGKTLCWCICWKKIKIKNSA